MFGKLTLRQLEDIGLLSGEVLSKVLLAGGELPRFKDRLRRLSVTYDIQREIQEEILSMKPEVFFNELEKNEELHKEKFGAELQKKRKEWIEALKWSVFEVESKEPNIKLR